jgi:hypothetical protein
MECCCRMRAELLCCNGCASFRCALHQCASQVVRLRRERGRSTHLRLVVIRLTTRHVVKEEDNTHSLTLHLATIMATVAVHQSLPSGAVRCGPKGVRSSLGRTLSSSSRCARPPASSTLQTLERGVGVSDPDSKNDGRPPPKQHRFGRYDNTPLRRCLRGTRVVALRAPLD